MDVGDREPGPTPDGAPDGAPDGGGPDRDLRWRLVLGDTADTLAGLGGEALRRDAALGFLYDREGEGSPDGSGLMTPTEWINEVYELFPRSVAERLGDDAMNRYGITEIVTSAEALERITPSTALVKAILNTKHLMEPGVLAKARAVVDTVVRRIVEQLTRPVRNPFTGPKDRHRRSRVRIAANFDPRATVRANLKHVDPVSGELVIAEPLFTSRVRRQQDRWQVVVCLDQSGSMADSVIHGAVTASIFHGIGALKTHLVAFDTEVADLSAEVGDPVEVLMGVQLGGGTDIHRAMSYARGLVDTPRRAVVVMISDFYEGGSDGPLVGTVRGMVADGVTVLCLGALSTAGASRYNTVTTSRLAAAGAHVAVMTPDRLAEWVAEVIA